MDITHLTNFIIQFRYFLLFPLLVIEGPGVTLFAAVLAAHGTFELEDIVVISVVANLCSDLLHYAAGRYGGPSFIQRWGRYIHVDMAHIGSAERHFMKHAGKSLLLGKLAFGLGSLVLVTAGLAKYSWRRFVLYCLAIELPKTVLIALLGYYGAKSYSSISHYLALSSVLLFVIGTVIVVTFINVSRRAKRAFEDDLA